MADSRQRLGVRYPAVDRGWGWEGWDPRSALRPEEQRCQIGELRVLCRRETTRHQCVVKTRWREAVRQRGRFSARVRARLLPEWDKAVRREVEANYGAPMRQGHGR